MAAFILARFIFIVFIIIVIFILTIFFFFCIFSWGRELGVAGESFQQPLREREWRRRRERQRREGVESGGCVGSLHAQPLQGHSRAP
jgi:hypothetical protein